MSTEASTGRGLFAEALAGRLDVEHFNVDNFRGYWINNRQQCDAFSIDVSRPRALHEVA